MLVTFHCKSYSNVTLFGEVALRLLALMGHSGTVPGAILAKDVPATLEKLKNAVASHQDEIVSNPERDAHNSDFDAPVSLAHRALPLIELFTVAAKEKSDVMWE